MGILLYITEGGGAVLGALRFDLLLLLQIFPIVVAGLLTGVLLRTLVPVSAWQIWLGRDSGLRGLVLATAGGAVTPGGPFACFPLALSLYRAGADIGVVVAYLTSWSTLAIARLLVFELPLLGWELTLAKVIVSLPLPIAAGFAARALHRATEKSVP